jgi:hypothetical protein
MFKTHFFHEYFQYKYADAEPKDRTAVCVSKRFKANFMLVYIQEWTGL